MHRTDSSTTRNDQATCSVSRLGGIMGDGSNDDNSAVTGPSGRAGRE